MLSGLILSDVDLCLQSVRISGFRLCFQDKDAVWSPGWVDAYLKPRGAVGVVVSGGVYKSWQCCTSAVPIFAGFVSPSPAINRKASESVGKPTTVRQLRHSFVAVGVALLVLLFCCSVVLLLCCCFLCFFLNRVFLSSMPPCHHAYAV